MAVKTGADKRVDGAGKGAAGPRVELRRGRDAGARPAAARPSGERLTVAVIGGGAGGTLAALELVREAQRHDLRLRILVVDRDQHGPGLAYSTSDDLHRLNVPSAKMSARPKAAYDFLDWSRSRCRCGACGRPGEFAPRRRYGRYLRDVIDEACTGAGSDVELVPLVAHATALRGTTLELADGRSVTCHAAVLALGNFPPAPVPHLPAHPHVISDPWRTGALDGIERPQRILLVGTGLTMVDVALTLAERHPQVEIAAISRSGLLPRVHLPEPEPPSPPVVPFGRPLELDDVVRRMRDAILAAGPRWRSVIDGMRPFTQRIWRALSIEDRRRFLGSVEAREWEVRRHRMAPPVGASLSALRAQDRLVTGRGQITGAEPRPGGRIDVRLAESGGERLLGVSHVINCTGPSHNVVRVANPLVHDLLASGRARPHPLGAGFQVDARGALIGVGTGPDPRLIAIGSLRRGALYETTAIPEIRAQASDAAETLVAALGGQALGSAATAAA
jgi:uncharacterized NAD(P)/FAD-binding protein YdhS